MVALLVTPESFTPTEDETKLALLSDTITWHESTLPGELAEWYEPNGPRYDKDNYNKTSEVKLATWVYPSEHPQGILTKPCPVCGYKYGTKHVFKPVPEDVLSFLASLPDTDITPAWV